MKKNRIPMIAGLFTLAAALLVTGCSGTPAAAPAPTPVPALPAGLRLEEHRLAAPPVLEPLTFSPLDGTQAEIQARHADLRGKLIADRLTTIDGVPAIRAAWGDGTLVAKVLTTNPETHEMTVELRDGDQVIFTAPAGFPSPAVALRGLWTYQGHWALEILLASPDSWKGQLYLDGQLLNDLRGYEEAFGSQLLGGKLFYFYRKDGVIGITYDGQEAVLGYTQVPHYRCCSESVINPQQAEDMLAFFAQREDTWYYVELGLFD